MPHHGLDVPCRHHHQTQPADAACGRQQGDVPGLRLRAVVRQPEPAVPRVPDLHRPRRVQGLADAHEFEIDAVRQQGAAVVGEVLADRPGQQRAQGETAQSHGDVAPAPPRRTRRVSARTAAAPRPSAVPSVSRPATVSTWSVAMAPVTAIRMVINS
ncbi:hypothetical protein [Streptomyces sp. NPDC049915]|uniref:hypothetical protein n=1 Tax=Streptomyces sp. NPDC049915 TaxID=3155510 RepID=UPI0034435E14